MTMQRTACALAALTMTWLAGSFGLQTDKALAHATLEVTQAPIRSTYKATIRIDHGCEGTATRRLRVRIPDGYVAVRPMPKAGWTIDTVRGPYTAPAITADGVVAEGVREVIWTGRLPDEHYDEFVVSGFLSDTLQPGSRLHIPIVQECEKGSHRWIQVPTPGKAAEDDREPAPSVRLLPANP